MDHKCIMEERVRALETGQVETRVYIKGIREDILEIKTELKKTIQGRNTENSKIWTPIVIELIKLIGLCVSILGAIVGAVKLLGK